MLRQLSNMLKSRNTRAFFESLSPSLSLHWKSIYAKPDISMLSASEELQIKET